jgi:ATP-binding cassette, subfamily B, bacterial PglK
MFNQFLQSYQILGKENRIKSLWLLIILLSIIALELLNFSLIIPVLTILFDKDSIEKITLISHLENFFGVNKFSLINLAVVFLILIILKVLLLLYFEYKTQKYSREMNVDMTLRAYSYFLNSSWQEILKVDHAYIMRTILSDIGTFVSEGILKFIEIIKNTLFLFFILGYLLFVNFKITIIIMGVLVSFTIILFILFKKKQVYLSQLTAEFNKSRYKNISESILNLRDIKLTGNSGFFLNLFEKNEKKATEVQIISKIMIKIPRYLLEIIIVTFAILIAYYIDSNNYDMNNYIPLLGLYAFAILKLIPIFTVYNQSIQAVRVSKYQIQEAIKNAERFKRIFKQYKLRERDEKLNIIDFNQDFKIKVSNLDFSYDDSKPIFENLNLELNKNLTIYLEGPNGSGKSTFVDLISGLLSPSRGTIKINDLNLIDVSNNWLKEVGYVSQTNFLMNNTIKENIVFGRENISEKNIIEIIKIVGLDELINSLPDGIDTNVGNLGSSFSGGQKQRIAIARALVSSPSVIILDEATNALDTVTEKNFLKIINKIKKNRIIIFIAHSKLIKDFCDTKMIIKDKKIEIIN